MKNINEVLKENIEDFDKQFGDLWSKVNDTIYKIQTGNGLKDLPIIISPKEIKQFLTQSNQNLISAFKEMVEEYKDFLRDNYGDIMDIELLDKHITKKLSSLTEEKSVDINITDTNSKEEAGKSFE
jgi:thermostable 8-oxoguanine DNA glycosylase